MQIPKRGKKQDHNIKESDREFSPDSSRMIYVKIKYG